MKQAVLRKNSEPAQTQHHVAQGRVISDNSLAAIVQRKRMEMLANTKNSTAQQPSNAAQRVEDEEPLQGKFEAVQRAEDEELLQGKFATLQRVEEEEPLQGMFQTTQCVEDEELLQGKFAAAQRMEEEEPLQAKSTQAASTQLVEQASAQPSNTGLPDQLKSGIESLSGMTMDHVKVHYNSSRPAQLNAHAYAQGSDIHVGPGQEKHLPHEAWHVVQQAQGRVKPTTQMKTGVPVNDDVGLESEADLMGAKATTANPANNVQLQSLEVDGSTVQRRLVTGDGVLHYEADTLGLAPSRQPSALVHKLLEDWQTYYLAQGAAPNLETVTELKVLKKMKYLLGESHGDGTWATRTAAWGNITKMREGLKGFEGESPEHARAIQTENETEKGVASGGEIPLEDMHHYTVGAILLVQQMLNDYPSWKDEAVFADRLEEVFRVLLKYALIGGEWFKSLASRPKEGSRAHQFMSVGLGNRFDPGWAVLDAVTVKKNKTADALSKPDRDALQNMLKNTVGILLALIDTRKLGGGFLGIGKSKQGPDPIGNRDRILGLSNPSSVSDGVAGVREASLLREIAMKDNILAGPAPLLVQIGNEHVDRLASAIVDAVPVKSGANFDSLITEYAPPEKVVEKKPSILNVNPDDYSPGMDDRWA